MPRWYVHLNGQQQGPFESIKVTSMLRLGTLKADDLVWHEGMENWTAAALVPELTGRAGNSVAPSATGLSAPAIAPVIGDDAGPFRRIAKQFRVLGRAWSGPVVVSAKAFYMMKVSRLGALHESGAAGALWAAAFETPDDTRTCGLADLPPHIRLQLDPKQKDVSRDVIVIKKEAVSLVKARSSTTRLRCTWGRTKSP